MAPRRSLLRSRRDPVADSPSDRLNPAGTPFERHVPLRERGYVVSGDSRRDTYRVRTNSGRDLVCGRLRSSPGDHDRIPNGTPVRVDFSLGAPYIDGILPLETIDATHDNPATITGTEGHGGQDPVFDRRMPINGRAAGEPDDVMPGDFVRTSTDGAAVAALRGKVGLLKGSDLAQIRCFGEDDAVHIVAGTLRQVTWMGESNVVNDGGRVSYTWRGGRDQVTQTGADEQRFTLHLDVGAVANGGARFRVTTPRGQTLFEVAVDGEGRATLHARGGIDTTQAGDAVRRVAGAEATEVTGARRATVGAEERLACAAARVVEVASNDSLTVGQDRVERVNRDLDVNVGGVSREQVTGDITVRTTRGNHALRVDTGNVETRASAGRVEVRADVGNIDLIPSAGALRVRTGNPDKIELGSDPTNHGVQYEPLATFLTSLVADYNRFKVAVAAATYPVSGPTAGPSPALAPFAAPFADTPIQARSLVVKLR